MAAFLLPACTGAAKPAATPAAPTSVSERAESSDALLERVLTPDEPGCSAAVGIEGRWCGWDADVRVAPMTPRPASENTA